MLNEFHSGCLAPRLWIQQSRLFGPLQLSQPSYPGYEQWNPGEAWWGWTVRSCDGPKGNGYWGRPGPPKGLMDTNWRRASQQELKKPISNSSEIKSKDMEEELQRGKHSLNCLRYVLWIQPSWDLLRLCSPMLHKLTSNRAISFMRRRSSRVWPLWILSPRQGAHQ